MFFNLRLKTSYVKIPALLGFEIIIHITYLDHELQKHARAYVTALAQNMSKFSLHMPNFCQKLNIHYLYP